MLGLRACNKPWRLANEQASCGQKKTHDALHEKRNSPRPVVLDVRAEIVDPYTDGIACDVSGEFNATHPSAVVGWRDFGLVYGHNGRKRSDTETSNDSSQKHHGDAGCECLESSTNDEDERAIQDSLASSDQITDAAYDQRGNKSTDF
jgi:hypothetical protein